MKATRFLPFCFLAFVVAGRADEVPADVKKIVEEHEKKVEEILSKAEEALKKAQLDKQKAEEEVRERKAKMIAQLEELAKNLAKQGKDAQAKLVAEYAEELKTGRVAGAGPDPGDLSTFRGQNGKTYLFEVTGANNGSVWGTDVYTDDSRLASAAAHAGVLKVGEKGAVKVTILAGENGYTGSTRNGVTTGNWGAYGGSFKVEPAKKGKRVGLAPAPAVLPVALPDPGTVGNLRGQIGKTIVYEVVGANTGTVWGSGVYTDDSHLATVAVHAGILKVGERGLVKVTILPGEPMYIGTMENGIQTNDYEAWGGSFSVEAVKKK